ncbi:MAG: hypothetical protein Tsb0013_12460 [Phycisphaerales bacterium]
MPEPLVTLWNVLLVLVGFGFVIFWHELGHFLTARWAKIRVLEFAVGFGPAILAYRKGIGVRRGSTNPAYDARLRAHREDLPAGADPDKVPGVSQTEYRLNWVPLGGYVKMLGQEDANPGATSDKPDSYTSVPVWKRLIVVSGGVIMNVILAAILFVVVYAVGLESNAPAVQVGPGTPAYDAGLRTGDVVRTVNNERVEVFQDLLLKVGLSKKDAPIEIGVERDGQALTFEVEPEYNEDAQIRAIGVYAMPGATVLHPPDAERNRFDEIVAGMGLAGLRPDMRLVSVNAEPIEPVAVDPWGDVLLPTALLDAAERSGGDVVTLGFVPAGPDLERALVSPEFFAFVPRPVLDRADVSVDGDTIDVPHILGLTPPMTVASTQPRAQEAGLRAGDLFARVGDVEWPDLASAIAQIRASAGGTVSVTLVRDAQTIDLDLPVDDNGLVGFAPDIASETTLLATAPTGGLAVDGADLRPGDRILSVAGEEVATLRDVYRALLGATRDAHENGAGATVEMVVRSGEDDRAIAWPLTPADVEALHALGWTGEHALRLFAPATVLQVGDGPVHSLALGLRETQRMLTRVYLTLGRLADGSVKPEQLKGPVGITHIGSRVAREGWIRLLFFIGLISANLAVLNFLPLPIVDGGLFLLLCYEGIRGKPAPVAVQNALTLVGLVLIAGVFLFVTTNDVLNLFG